MMDGIGNQTEVLYYFDGGETVSNQWSQRKAVRNAEAGNALQLLTELEETVLFRMRTSAANWWYRFPTDETHPRIFVIVDHYENIFPLAAERFARLARDGSKAGIHLRAGEGPLTLEAFGHCDTLRAYCDLERQARGADGVFSLWP